MSISLLTLDYIGDVVAQEFGNEVVESINKISTIQNHNCQYPNKKIDISLGSWFFPRDYIRQAWDIKLDQKTNVNLEFTEPLKIMLLDRIQLEMIKDLDFEIPKHLEGPVFEVNAKNLEFIDKHLPALLESTAKKVSKILRHHFYPTT